MLLVVRRTMLQTLGWASLLLVSFAAIPVTAPGRGHGGNYHIHNAEFSGVAVRRGRRISVRELVGVVWVVSK